MGLTSRGERPRVGYMGTSIPAVETVSATTPKQRHMRTPTLAYFSLHTTSHCDLFLVNLNNPSFVAPPLLRTTTLLTSSRSCHFNLFLDNKKEEVREHASTRPRVAFFLLPSATA